MGSDDHDPDAANAAIEALDAMAPPAVPDARDAIREGQQARAQVARAVHRALRRRDREHKPEVEHREAPPAFNILRSEIEDRISMQDVNQIVWERLKTIH